MNCFTSLQQALCIRATERRLLPDESPSLSLLFFKESVKAKRRRQPRERPCVEQFSDDASDDSEDFNARDFSTQMDQSSMLIEKELTATAEHIAVLELKVKSLEQELGAT